MRHTVGLVLVSLISAIGPAGAHAILIDGTPQPHGTVPAGVLVVRLQYNTRLDATRSRLTLTDPAGHAAVLPQTEPDAPNVLRARADLSPGGWSLRWQVLALDGHITRGDLAFTVTPSAAAPAAATP